MQIVENEFFEYHQNQANIHQDTNQWFLQRFFFSVLKFHFSTRARPKETSDRIRPKVGLDPKLCYT